MEGQCFKCRKKTKMVSYKLGELIVKGIKKHRITGLCSVCGSKMSKLVKGK